MTRGVKLGKLEKGSLELGSPHTTQVRLRILRYELRALGSSGCKKDGMKKKRVRQKKCIFLLLGGDGDWQGGSGVASAKYERGRLARSG